MPIKMSRSFACEMSHEGAFTRARKRKHGINSWEAVLNTTDYFRVAFCIDLLFRYLQIKARDHAILRVRQQPIK